MIIRKQHVLGGLGMVLAASSCVSAGEPPLYTIVDLGPVNPTSESNSTSEAINEHGQVAGGSTSFGGLFSMTMWLDEPAYGLAAGPNDLGDLAGEGSRAYGMNNLGQAVGFSNVPQGGAGWATAMLWDSITGTGIDLGSLGGTHSIARAINDDGLICGESDSADPDVFRRAFLSDGDTMVDLGSFDPGAFQSRAEDINALGQVVGHGMYLDNLEQPDNSRLRAALWLPEPAYGLPAGINDIDDRSVFDWQFTTAHGVNDRGQVVIWGSNPLPNGQAFSGFWLWLPEADYGLSAGLNDMRGAYGISATAFGQDINNRGEAVFRANVDPDALFGDWRAMVWRQGEWFDLINSIPIVDQLEWWFGSATDINDRGQIVGWGWKNGQGRAFRLDPVLNDVYCPADVSGDGDVGFTDLVAVLSNWGNTSGPADVDGNGLVDFNDVVAVLAAWGPCVDEMGACCFPTTGDCETLSSVNCEFMSGTFTGGTTCESFACAPALTGACCFAPSGICNTMSAFECDIALGTWQSGTTCAGASCPQSPQGDWIGDPFVIDRLPYADSGDTSGFGNWYDEICDGTWAEAPEVVYAYTPVRDEVVNISLCEDSAYDTKLYVYENDVNTVVGCNQDACTTPSFPVNAWVSRMASVELIAGQTYYIVVDGWGIESGVYTIDVESISAGACCMPDGSCVDLSSDLCAIAPDAIWFSSESCDTFACPPFPAGACCLPGGTCVSNQTEWDCLNLFGGSWQGEGVSCFGANCP